MVFFITPFVVGESDGKKPTEVSRLLMVLGRRLRNPSLRKACRFCMWENPMNGASVLAVGTGSTWSPAPLAWAGGAVETYFQDA